MNAQVAIALALQAAFQAVEAYTRRRQLEALSAEDRAVFEADFLAGVAADTQATDKGWTDAGKPPPAPDDNAA